VVIHVIDTILALMSLEYPLALDSELLVETPALWIEGVGCVGQYNSYYETVWEHGLMFFVRDCYLSELQKKQREASLLNEKLQILNSKILAIDTCR